MSPVCAPPHRARVPTLLGRVMGAATRGALLGGGPSRDCSCGSRVGNRFVLDVFTGCLYLQIVNTDLNKKKHSVVGMHYLQPGQVSPVE